MICTHVNTLRMHQTLYYVHMCKFVFIRVVIGYGLELLPHAVALY